VASEQLRQRLGVVVGEAVEAGAMGAGDHGAVPDGLVGAGVDEDGALVGEHRDDRGVDVGQGRQQQGVLDAEQPDQALLDLLVEGGAAEHARPTRVGAPPP
jgi:hypothetical protein